MSKCEMARKKDGVKSVSFALEGRDDRKRRQQFFFLAVSRRESRKKMKNGKMNGDG